MIERRAALAACLTAALLLAGCGSPSGSPTTNVKGSPPGSPQRGGTLVAAIGGDPPSLNPDVTTGVPDQLLGCMLYPSLVRVGSDYAIKPFLAKSWDISSDGLTYTFHLVDATWQDGQPFTSADVKYTLTQVSARYGPRFAEPARDIQTVDTPDEHTAVIRLKRPFGPLLFVLSCANNTGILPAHVFQGTDVLKNPAGSSKPVSIGPFTLSEWVRGDHLTFDRNPKYWHAGLPYLDRVVVKIIPQPSSRILALESGQIDYLQNYFVQLSDYPVLAKQPKLHLDMKIGYPVDTVIILNVRRPPLDKPAVRQALYMALDRNYLLKAIFSGLGNPGKSAIDSRIAWAYNTAVDYEKMYPYDPAKAKQLLDDAGVKPGPDGTRFTVHLVFDSTRADYVGFAQAVQNFWQAVGVKVVLDGAERQVELPRVYSDWNFDATLQEYTTAGDPALGISRLYTTSAIVKAPFVNASGYSNPEVDRLFDEGALASSQSDRAGYYRQVQTILARDLPTLVITENTHVEVANQAVHDGLWLGKEGYDWWDGVWLSR